MLYTHFVPQDIGSYSSSYDKNTENMFLIFADLKGFTKMSSELSEFKLEGAEILADLINQAMTLIINEVKKYNGIIYKFAGDAITIYFNEKNFSIYNVLDCAISIIEIIKKNSILKTEKASYDIAIKIGISYGKMQKTGS